MFSVFRSGKGPGLPSLGFDAAKEICRDVDPAALLRLGFDDGGPRFQLISPQTDHVPDPQTGADGQLTDEPVLFHEQSQHQLQLLAVNVVCTHLSPLRCDKETPGLRSWPGVSLRDRYPLQMSMLPCHVRGRVKLGLRNPLIPDYPGIIGLSMHVLFMVPTVPGM